MACLWHGHRNHKRNILDKLTLYVKSRKPAIAVRPNRSDLGERALMLGRQQRLQPTAIQLGCFSALTQLGSCAEAQQYRDVLPTSFDAWQNSRIQQTGPNP